MDIELVGVCVTEALSSGKGVQSSPASLWLDEKLGRNPLRHEGSRV